MGGRQRPVAPDRHWSLIHPLISHLSCLTPQVIYWDFRPAESVRAFATTTHQVRGSLRTMGAVLVYCHAGFGLWGSATRKTWGSPAALRLASMLGLLLKGLTLSDFLPSRETWSDHSVDLFPHLKPSVSPPPPHLPRLQAEAARGEALPEADAGHPGEGEGAGEEEEHRGGLQVAQAAGEVGAQPPSPIPSAPPPRLSALLPPCHHTSPPSWLSLGCLDMRALPYGQWGSACHILSPPGPLRLGHLGLRRQGGV